MSARIGRLPIILVAAAALAASGSAAKVAPAGSAARRGLEQIITAEHEFAKDSIASGVKASFLRYVAPDGVIFRPRPVPAVETIRSDPDDDPRDGFLDWWPATAGISSSGDLGFSVGPWHQHLIKPPANYPADVYGYYCTIWRRQGDGTYKYVVDGAGAFLGKTAPTRPKGAAVVKFPIPSATARSSAAGATAEIAALETRLQTGLRADARGTMPAYYDARAWVMGSPVEVIPGRAGWTAELERRPARMDLTPKGGGASSSGDLVYTYGTVESLDPQMALRDATYLHIWMRQQGRWKIVFDGLKQRRS